jgi:hypothetical protein
MKLKTMRNGLIAAGLINIGGVLVFSRLFSNQALNQADPVVMSNFGLVMIMVWGLAYLGAAASGVHLRWLAGAFALEKLVYVAVWLAWHSSSSVAQLYSIDAFAGIFYAIYGLNDLVFMAFFAWMFLARPSVQPA